MGQIRQYDLEKVIKTHIKNAGLSQAAVARKLYYTPEQFNKWIRGVNRIPDVAIQEFSDLLDLNDEERTELFTLAGYVAVTALNQTVDRTDTHKQDKIAYVASSNDASTGLNSAFFIDALKDWSNSFFRWSEASPHMRSSWAGLVIHAMSAVTGRITPRGLLIFCISLLLWIVTAYLMMPVLRWPLDNAEARWLAVLKYGLATWLIPLLVTFVTSPDREGLFRLETPKQKIMFWILKFTGALVGFWVFSVVVIGLVLVLYYLYVPPLVGTIRAVLALVPLFLAYVAARRIPVDRHKMFNGELRIHPADRLFLATFIVLGPFLALFLYFFYWFLSDRAIAPVTLLILIIGMALWDYRKQHLKSISDPILNEDEPAEELG